MEGQAGEIEPYTSIIRVPKLLADGRFYKKIIASEFSTCGLTFEGKLICWGLTRSLGGSVVGINQAISGPLNVDSSGIFGDLFQKNTWNCGVSIEGKTKCWDTYSRDARTKDRIFDWDHEGP